MVSAQDKIFRKNGKVITAKVIEVGVTDIKYTIPTDPQSPVYVLEKANISKIEFQNGKVDKFTVDLKDAEQYSGQLRKAITIDFLGPLVGYSQISFEKSTGVGKGYEVTLGIIGAGKNQQLNFSSSNITIQKRNQFGISTSFGYKFNKLPDYIFGRMRLTHIMQGSYLKPIIYLGNYSENRIIYKGNQYVADRPNITFGTLQIELGKQWIFDNKFVFDTYWGVGYGFDNKTDNSAYNLDNTSSYNYINLRAGRSPGLSITYGVKVGMLIK